MNTYQVIIDSNYSILIEAEGYSLRNNGTIEFFNSAGHVTATFSLNNIVGFTALSDNIKLKENKG